MILLLCSAVASAHIGLEDPKPRYASDGLDGKNKACPCGVGDSNRLCDDPTDTSDPDRNENRASTFAASETITLVFDEVIGHSGRFRVAFDPDGADLDDFNDHILLDVPDPIGDQGNVGQGIRWELEVTLPDTPCSNCTLQLVQMMDGNTVDPVPDPAGRSSYYQCVDLVLTDGTTTGVTDTDPSLADTGASMDGAGCGCSAAATLSSAWVYAAGLALAGRRRRRTQATVGDALIP